MTWSWHLPSGRRRPCEELGGGHCAEVWAALPNLSPHGLQPDRSEGCLARLQALLAESLVEGGGGEGSVAAQGTCGGCEGGKACGQLWPLWWPHISHPGAVAGLCVCLAL